MPRNLWLSYREWNTQARRLYQSLGFQERAIEPNGRDYGIVEPGSIYRYQELILTPWRRGVMKENS